MVFTQPPYPIPLFYIIASPAQLWRAGTRAFKFQAGHGAVKAFGKRLCRLCVAPVLVPLGRMLSARSAVIWACRKVVVGASGPFGHRQVLLKLLARRCLDCFGAVPAGTTIYR